MTNDEPLNPASPLWQFDGEPLNPVYPVKFASQTPPGDFTGEPVNAYNFFPFYGGVFGSNPTNPLDNHPISTIIINMTIIIIANTKEYENA